MHSISSLFVWSVCSVGHPELSRSRFASQHTQQGEAEGAERIGGGLGAGQGADVKRFHRQEVVGLDECQ